MSDPQKVISPADGQKLIPERPRSETRFSAQEIGKRTAKSMDLFAKQRQEYETRQRRQHRILRSVIIILTCLLVMMVALAVILIFVLRKQPSAPAEVDDGIPPEMEIWNGEAQQLQGAAQEIYDQPDNEETSDAEVDEYFDQQVEAAPTDMEKVNLVLVQMQFYANNFQPEKVVAVAEQLDVELLTTSQVGLYTGMLMNAYINLGDNAKAEYYLNLMEAKGAVGGGEG